MSSSAYDWFEGRKTDLRNPFELQAELWTLQQRHDRVEEDLRRTPTSVQSKNTHDFLTTCLELLNGWKIQLGADAAASGTRGILELDRPETITAGRAAAKEWARGIKNMSIMELENRIQYTRDQSERAQLRYQQTQGTDPMAIAEVTFWSSYRQKLVTIRPWIVSQDFRSYNNWLKEPVSPAGYPVMPVTPVNPGGGFIPAPDPKKPDSISDTSYIWWVAGIAGAGILAVYVLA